MRSVWTAFRKAFWWGKPELASAWFGTIAVSAAFAYADRQFNASWLVSAVMDAYAFLGGPGTFFLTLCVPAVGYWKITKRWIREAYGNLWRGMRELEASKNEEYFDLKNPKDVVLHASFSFAKWSVIAFAVSVAYFLAAKFGPDTGMAAVVNEAAWLATGIFWVLLVSYGTAWFPTLDEVRERVSPETDG